MIHLPKKSQTGTSTEEEDKLIWMERKQEKLRF